ncbi:FimV/HubP family polar landmark protein [Marinobacter sp.]|uniref:FimV/HubP family polar landmark protein n=1 Tax=Marinobacter sp. TaxID=50741 RepID=UPI00384EB1DB
MKVRKLAVALALAGGLGSGVAQALGLGEVELQSFLNEPLDAEIPLRKTEGVSRDNIIVELASPQSFERLGIDRDFFLTNLRFSVDSAPGGGLVVNVTSRQPVREPYLNFLIEVNWPSGRLMREYSLLLDPPVYAEQSGLEEQVQAPATTQPRQQQPARATRLPTQEPARNVASAPRSGSAFGPTGPSDTLWAIAQAARPSNQVTPQQVMLAIQDLNPDAFIGDNINRLKQGEVLRIPSLDQVQQRSPAEAARQVRVQNEAIAAGQRPVDATDADDEQQAAPARAEAGDELRLIAADDGEGRTADEGGSVAGTDAGTGGAEAGQAVALEELDRTRRENEELSSRLQDMEDQVQTLQRLIELKNTQLSEMQEMVGEDAPAEQPPAMDGAGPEADAEMTPGADTDAATDAPVAVDEDAADIADEETETEQPVEDAAREEAGAEVAAEADEAAEPVTEEAPAAEPTDEAGEVAEAEDAPVAEPAPAVTPPAAEQPVKDKGFPGNVIDEIKGNTLYQVALGGGLILLLFLLLLLARRNANREKEFYEQLNRESGTEEDSFDLEVAEESAAAEELEGADPLADADVYIAYGRLDQAAQALEGAISREPSRSDLRLKLLGVYADSQDRSAFEKQLRELEALEDGEAIAEAEALRHRLEEAESGPSIDDLESQLRSGSFEAPAAEPAKEAAAAEAEDEYSFDFEEGFDLEEPEAEKKAVKDEESPESDDFESALEDLELDEESLLESAGEEESEKKEEEYGAIEYDLSVTPDESELDEEEIDTSTDKDLEDLSLELEKDAEDDYTVDFKSDTTLDEADELAETEEAVEPRALTEEPLDLEEEMPSLKPEDVGIDSAETGDQVYQTETPKDDEEALIRADDGSLDESFLDELDAELEKVAGEDDIEGLSSLSGDELDDLELDVSDEDLALMEEVADRGGEETEKPEAEKEELELDVEDTLSDADLDLELEPGTDEERLAGAPIVEPEGPDVSETAEEKPPARPSESPELQESDLGEEDDFDFLSGTDEAATKLDLARAYVEMGDADGARDILEEVAIEGSEEQKAEAQDMLKNLP